MALDYTVKYSSKIAERFKKASITDSACGHEYDFTGARGVKIYSMDTAPLVDYDRGGTRYGDVSDLTFTTQEMLCTQAKAFSRHLEVLDNSDIAIDAAAGKFLRTELDEVMVPTMDKYRLKAWAMGAATLHQMSKEPTVSTIVGDIMALKGMMLDGLVPDTGLTLFIRTKYFVMLKQAQAVVNLERAGNEAVIKGKVGEFDGMDVKVVPDTYFPADMYFMIKHAGSTADPVKLAQYDVIPKSVGYSGPVVQGLAYYDAFVIGTKNKGIGVAGGKTFILDAPAVSVSGGTATCTLSGADIYYTVDGSDPRSSSTREKISSGATAKVAPGQKIRVIGQKANSTSLEIEKPYA